MKKLFVAFTFVHSLAFAQTMPAPSTPRPSLVPCVPGLLAPCVVIATSPADLVGVWKQYVGNPVFAPSGNMGYIRYNADGTFALGGTPEATRTPVAPCGPLIGRGSRA